MLKTNHLGRLFLFVVVFSINTSILVAQSDQAVPDSTSFKTVIDKSFQELDESNYSKEVQLKYAEIFFQRFVNKPNSEYSEWALAHAFKFWMNTKAVDKTENAMAQLDPDSKYWRHIIGFIFDTYKKNGQKEEGIKQLKELTEKLTHSQGKSSVYSVLARNYYHENNIDDLKEVGQKVINLNANERQVENVLRYLRDLQSLNIGQKAPNFKTQTLQGKSISLSDHKGKVILVEFWATWCGPCISEIPPLKSTYSKYSDNDFEIIGISLDKNSEKLKTFVEEKKLQWPQIQQQKGLNSKLAELYSVVFIPRNYLIGKDGKIIAKDLWGEELETKVAELLK